LRRALTQELFRCGLEIPAIGRHIATGTVFTAQGALRDFEGRDGEDLANSVLDTAQDKLSALEDTLGTRVQARDADLKRRIARRRANVKTSSPGPNGLRTTIAPMRENRYSSSANDAAALASLMKP